MRILPLLILVSTCSLSPAEKKAKTIYKYNANSYYVSLIKKNYYLGITTFYPNQNDSSERKGNILLMSKRNESFDTLDKIYYHYIGMYYPSPYLPQTYSYDLNGDLVKDYLIVKGMAASSSYVYYDIIVVSTKHRKLVRLKAQDEIINPILDGKVGIRMLDNFNKCIVHYNIVADSLIEFKRVPYSDD